MGEGRRNRLGCAGAKQATGFGGEGVRNCLQRLKGRCGCVERGERKLSPDPLRLKTSDGLHQKARGGGWVKGGETAWVVLESNKLQDSGERE